MFALGADPVVATPSQKLVETARQTYGLYALYPSADQSGAPQSYRWQTLPAYAGSTPPPGYNYPTVDAARQAMTNFFAAQRIAAMPAPQLPITMPAYSVAEPAVITVETPIYEKPLFWVAIGGASLAAYLIAKRK